MMGTGSLLNFMAQQLEISPEHYPNRVGSGGLWSTKVDALKTHNGDVEIARTIGGDTRTVLTVIPKHMRAALAQFLVEE